MIQTLSEVAAGVGAMIGAFATVVVGTAVVTVAGDPGMGQLLVESYGPIGAAVALLWWRLDRIEERVAENEAELHYE